MSDIQQIIDFITDFRNQRNWAQFHNPKDLALALSIEAAELNELYLWKKDKEIDAIDREKISDELADILVYAFFLAEKYGFDVKDIIMKKMPANTR